MSRILTRFLSCCLVLSAINLHADTFLVTNLNSGGAGSFRAAAQATFDNGDTDRDTILVTVAGIITLDTADVDGFNFLRNQSNVYIQGNAAGTTLRRVPDPNPGNPDANHYGRFFQVTNCHIKDITFDGGIAILTGGGLFISGNSNIIENCGFLNNLAGSAAYPNDPTDYTGLGSGGAIRLNGAGSMLTLRNCIFTENQAQNGAAIRAFPGTIMNIFNCTFSGNIVDNGGDDGTQSTVYNQGTIDTLGFTVLANTIPEGTPDIYDVGNTINTNINNLVEICNGAGCEMGGAAEGFAFTNGDAISVTPPGPNGGLSVMIQASSSLINFNLGANPVGTEVRLNPATLARDLPTMSAWKVSFLAVLLLSLSSFLLFSNKRTL